MADPMDLNPTDYSFEDLIDDQELRTLEETMHDFNFLFSPPLHTDSTTLVSQDDQQGSFQNYGDELWNHNDLFVTEQNHNLNQEDPSDIGEPPTSDDDVKYKNLIESLVEQVTSRNITNEIEPFRYSSVTTKTSVKTRKTKSNLDHKNETIKVVKSSDTSNMFISFGSDPFALISNVAPLSISAAPCPYQHSRYESDFSKAIRYIFVPSGEFVTLNVPDLRSILPVGCTVQLRITRVTLPFGTSGLSLIHPYPIWIKNNHAEVHPGSLFINVTEEDMANGSVKIENLAMVQLKQSELSKMKTFSIYSETQVTSTGLQTIEETKAKDIIKTYELQSSILIFQLVLVDKDKLTYCSNLICNTDPIQFYGADEIESLRDILDAYNITMRRRSPFKGKRTNQFKKPLARKSRNNRRVVNF